MDAPAAVDPDRRTLVRRVTLVLLVLVVFAGAFVPFVLRLEHKDFSFDDNRFIVQNPHVSTVDSVGEALRRLPRYMVDPNMVDPLSPRGIVRPLRTFEFALDRALFQFDAGAFAVHNALWHAAAAVAVMALLLALFENRTAAVFGALVYGAHPMHVEAVSFISSRGDVAMGACLFTSLALFARSRGWDRRLALSLAFGLLAMLYKETALTLPFLTVAVFWLRSARDGETTRLWPRALAASVPFVVLAAAYVVYRQTVAVGGTSHVDTFVLGGSTAGTFATMFRAFGYYVASAFLPGTSSVDWYMPVSTSLVDGAALGWMLLHGALLGGALFATRRMPRAAAAVVLFYAPLIPVANWPFPLGIPCTDRFLYLSLLGLGVGVAIAWTRLPLVRRRAAFAALVLVVLSFAAGTWRRTADWVDEETLWETAVASYPTPRGYGYMGAELRRKGFHLQAESRRAKDPVEARRLRKEAQEVLREALHYFHEAIDLWHWAERVERSDSFVLLEPESNAANCLFLLGEADHGLVHAQEALRVGMEELGPGKFDQIPPTPAYNLAYLRRDVGRPVGALVAMELSIAQGMHLDPPEAREFFRPVAAQLFDIGAYELALRAAGWENQFAPDGGARVERAEAAMRQRFAALQAAAAAGEPGAEEALALFRAGLGTRAGPLPAAPPAGVSEVDWIQAAHEFRGSTDGWEAAVRAYEGVRSDPARAAYRRAVCEDLLGRHEEALASVRAALDGAGVAVAWRADAERMRTRIETGCPVKRSHGLPGR